MIHKPHTWVEINKKALEHNLHVLKNAIGEGILAPVIKGNAYGHGLLEVGRVCQESNAVDYVCVAALSDALLLRKHAFSKPILVLVYLDDDPKLAIEHDIDLLIYDLETAKELNEIAKQLNKQVVIHAKMDTGLSRFGFNPEKATTLVKQMLALPFITIRGIATHFAQSEIPDQEFTLNQIAIFKKAVEQLEAENINIPFKHLSNSAATLRFIPRVGNFFRPGVGIYGYWSSTHIKELIQQTQPEIELQPIATWKTRIFSVKTVPINKSVGYGRTFCTQKETVLATIPVGYYDGYKRELSNCGQVLIGTSLAPVIGIIGMNTTTLDITHIPNTKKGDEVILLGDYDGVRANNISSLLATNVRMITTCISPTIERRLI